MPACLRPLIAALLLLPLTSAWSEAKDRPDGAALYARHCERCHGISGRGDGPDAELFASRPRDLRDGVLTRYSTEDLVQRVRTGRPLALDLPAWQARTTDVEALAAHLARLPTIDWPRAELGRQVYLDRCELCHGPAGQPGPTTPGAVRPPRNLADPAFQRQVTDRDLARVVRHGRDAMPALTPPVASAEVAPLVAFVRLLSPGFALYDRYCAACHGDDGRGAGTSAPDGRRPTVVFDAAYFQRRDPAEVRGAIWHMRTEQDPAMPHFRSVLTEPEAGAIIDYLRQTQ